MAPAGLENQKLSRSKATNKDKDLSTRYARRSRAPEAEQRSVVYQHISSYNTLTGTNFPMSRCHVQIFGISILDARNKIRVWTAQHPSVG